MLVLEQHRPKDVLARGQHAGYLWVIMHNNMGYRCGYVLVPEGHRCLRQYIADGCSGYNVDLDVHGGVTFVEKDTDGRDYWVGFDCGHYGDAVDPSLPGSEKLGAIGNQGAIRTQEYVVNQCMFACEQLAADAGE